MDAGEPNRMVCARCVSWQAMRAKHCFVCDRCCAVWDHHCLWLSTCIGANNRHFFLVLLISQYFCQLIFLIVAWVGMGRVLSSEQSELGLLSRFTEMAVESPVVMFFFLYQGLVWGWTHMVIWWQIAGISRSLTTAELAHGDRYWYMQNGNRFDRGTINNFI